MDTTNPIQTQVETALNDVSPRVHELMQRLDRLPPGTYQLTIIKNEVRAADWTGEILQVEFKKVEQFYVSKSGSYSAE
jgi:hypothetical protein